MKNRLSFLLAVPLCILMLLPSCKSGAQGGRLRGGSSSSDSIKIKPFEKPVEVRPVANDSLTALSRVIAGLPLEEGSPLYSYTRTPEWEKYRIKMDTMWSASTTTLEKVSEIRKLDFKDITDKTRTVLYTFSGPDFPFMATFFPDADTYYMMGLERSGSVLTTDALNKKTYDKFEKALYYLLEKSYFVTSYMASDLNNAEIDGTIPIFMVLMARMGYKFVSIDYVDLTPDGNWELSQTRKPFVKIRYFKEGEPREKTLYYLSTNIADGEIDPRVVKLIGKLSPDSTSSFIKSCSYCLHYDEFSKIRSLILDSSYAIIQDDTGIRYDVYKKGNWDITLYGSYTQPNPLFPKGVFQSDLNQVYKTSSEIRPLGFRFGYNWKGSSMIVCRRPKAE